MADTGADRPYGVEEIRERLVLELPHWRFEDGQICRRYRTSGWKSTLMVINTIGHLAEAAWHHPDLVASYAAVEVKLSTHDAQGVTGKDFALAAMIEQVVQWRPAMAGGPLTGTPDDPRHAHVVYDA